MRDYETEEEIIKKEIFEMRYKLQLLNRHVGNPEYAEEIEKFRKRFKELKKN